MGHAIPKQHPAVVLRSHFNLVRALLGVAMIALVGMTIALVIVANDDDEAAPTSAVEAAPVTPQFPAYPTPSPEAVNPQAGRVYSGPAPTRKLDGSTDIPNTAPVAPGTRYDGGPDEGSRGIQQSSAAPEGPLSVNPSTGYATPRYDGGPEEGTRSPLTSPLSPQSRADDNRGPGFRTD
jgi:hypothetical protein